MKNVCDIVQDILPLYVDDVCSDSSKSFVEEHLAECAKCSETMNSLKRNAIESNLIDEKENVLKHHFRAAKRKTFTVGVITAGVLMIPVIVCLIVNLATGHALNWFFIVLTSLLITASLTVVPLVFESKKLLWTTGSFLGSLLLLLATCCIYTGGRWFFMAAISVLLGTSTLILPIIAKKYFCDNSFWKRNKGLLVFTSDTILLYSLNINNDRLYGFCMAVLFDSKILESKRIDKNRRRFYILRTVFIVYKQDNLFYFGEIYSIDWY